MKLSNWSIIASPNSPYDAPELWVSRLHGTVHGHPSFPDGSEITTSQPVSQIEGKIKTSSGSVYELGEVSPEYEAKFPKARERLLASIDELKEAA